MKTAKHITGLLLTTLLLISGISAHADVMQNPHLSLDNKVAHPVVSSLLKASKVGRFYRVQASTSKVWFSIDSIAKKVTGNFTHFKGGIALQPHAGNNGEGIFIIKTNSISTSNMMIDKVVRSKSFFNVEQYPEIRFVSTDFSWLSATRGVLKGKLTLHGVTKAFAYNVELSDIHGNKVGDSDTILIKISTSISRSEFGMKLMSSVVSDTVNLDMTIQAKRHNNISKELLVALSTYSGF
jgi:polyisoprenoid-binding protein YceI